jgi:hypothetical protein
MKLDSTLQFTLAQLHGALLRDRQDLLASLLTQADLGQLLSQDTIETARAQGHVAMVIFLNTLAVANEVEPEQAQQWLDVYRSISQKHIQGQVLSWSKHDVLRMVVTAMAWEGALHATSIKKVRGSTPHWVSAFELLVDFKDWVGAKALVQALGDQPGVFSIQARMARSLAHRHRQYVDSTGMPKVDIDYAALADLYAHFGRQARAHRFADLVGIFGNLESSAWEVAGQYHKAITLLKSSNNAAFSPGALLDQARCHCKAGDLTQAIAVLDGLLERALAARPGSAQADTDNALEAIEGEVREPPKLGFDVRAASHALGDLARVANQRQVPVFLVSGTLLGFEREGELLAHDKDVDVGIIGWENQFELCIALQQDGTFTIFPAFLKGRDTVYMPVRHNLTGTWIDVFIYHPQGDKLVTGVDFFYGYRQSFAFTPFELKPVQFLGVDMCVPNDVDLNLTENYGNWREPDVSYISHLESPSTVDKGGLPFMLTARLAAYQALVKRKPSKLMKIAQLMREHAKRPSSMSDDLIARLDVCASVMVNEAVLSQACEDMHHG